MQSLIYFSIILILCLVSSTNAIDIPTNVNSPDTTEKVKPSHKKEILREQKMQTKTLKKKDLKLDTLLLQLNIDTNNLVQ